jgi:K+-transporting ATPase ATPase B chain
MSTATARVGAGLFDPRLLARQLPAALRKLDPRVMVRTPVMFVVEIGSVLTTILAISHPSVFAWVVTAWLWLTVVFATLAEAVAEGRGKAQADTLRKTRRETVARRLLGDGREEQAPATALCVGDLVVVEAGQIIPGDGDVVEGVASVDESAITGESPRSSGNRAGTAAPSPAGRRCSPTGSSCRSHRSRARPSSTA